MANSMEEARLMVRTSEEAGKLYMVSQNYRLNPLPTTMRDAIRGGMIGDVTTVNADFYIGAHFGGFRDEMPSPLLLDMSIHHFDLSRYMSGADPVAVYAKEFNPKASWYQGDVAASCIFEMSDGVVFTYRGSWCAQGFNTPWNGNWRFIGTNGALLMEYDQQPRAQVVAGNEGFVYPFEEKTLDLVEMPYRGQSAALREMLAFLNDGTVPQSECHDNIKSLAMVFAAIESSRAGGPVPVKAL